MPWVYRKKREHECDRPQHPPLFSNWEISEGDKWRCGKCKQLWCVAEVSHRGYVVWGLVRQEHQSD